MWSFDCPVGKRNIVSGSISKSFFNTTRRSSAMLASVWRASRLAASLYTTKLGLSYGFPS
jgi:hypothetical protein